MEKGKGGSGGIGRHIDRLESKYGYTTYGHSDPSKRELNESFILNKYCSEPLYKAIEERIKEGYTGQTAIRRDAVKFQTHILTGSHEEMKQIFSLKKTADRWIQANIDWMIEKYGKDNIVRFTLHMDEKTPHIHVVTVPITPDGRLSAKSYANGKKALRELQTDYACKMEPFGLQRGLERVGISHESAQEYYAKNKREDEYIKSNNITLIEPKRGFFKTNISEIYNQNQELSKLVVSYSQKLMEQESQLRKMSEISLLIIRRSRELVTDKDSIINKEIQSRTNIYRKELENIKKTLFEKGRLLNIPERLIERDVQLQKQIKKDLLHELELHILSESRLKLELGESIDIANVDNWIREYAPKEKLGVNNSWKALDILTDENRGHFESMLLSKIEDMEEEISNKKKQRSMKGTRM